jgi:hypothetical protein
MRPERVVDCKSGQLVEENSQPYVCLSYVWGSKAPTQEALDNLLPINLPATISDAMVVTLKIGLRYLWVDRYCIDQNNADEKHNIVRNMDAICKLCLLQFYSYAMVNMKVTAIMQIVEMCNEVPLCRYFSGVD